MTNGPELSVGISIRTVPMPQYLPKTVSYNSIRTDVHTDLQSEGLLSSCVSIPGTFQRQNGHHSDRSSLQAQLGTSPQNLGRPPLPLLVFPQRKRSFAIVIPKTNGNSTVRIRLRAFAYQMPGGGEDPLIDDLHSLPQRMLTWQPGASNLGL